MGNPILIPSEVEAIERATVAAVAPAAVEEFDGWLLAYDAGTIGRAKCAVPLGHARHAATSLLEIERRYLSRGIVPMFRLADTPGFDPVRSVLVQRGYSAGKPTLVQIALVTSVQAIAPGAAVEIADQPDAAWAAVFLGEGFDPVDGAGRVAALSRAPGSIFASVRENGRAIAAGAGAFAHGWASVHGMRTELARRGEGLAARVLSGLAAIALARGMARIFLQVEAHNAPALALYRRAGFQTVWKYEYWRQS